MSEIGSRIDWRRGIGLAQGGLTKYRLLSIDIGLENLIIANRGPAEYVFTGPEYLQYAQ